MILVLKLREELKLKVTLHENQENILFMTSAYCCWNFCYFCYCTPARGCETRQKCPYQSTDNDVTCWYYCGVICMSKSEYQVKPTCFISVAESTATAWRDRPYSLLRSRSASRTTLWETASNRWDHVQALSWRHQVSSFETKEGSHSCNV